MANPSAWRTERRPGHLSSDSLNACRGGLYRLWVEELPNGEHDEPVTDYLWTDGTFTAAREAQERQDILALVNPGNCVDLEWWAGCSACGHREIVYADDGRGVAVAARANGFHRVRLRLAEHQEAVRYHHHDLGGVGMVHHVERWTGWVCGRCWSGQHDGCDA